MKKLLAIILVFLFLMGSTTAFAATSATITGDMVNLRTGAGTGYTRSCYLYTGDTVTVTGASGSWTKVLYNGQSGYVYSQYVSTAYTATASVTNLYYGCSGTAVRALQENLILLGYLNDTADGVFGSKTAAAVRLYQTKNGLTVDGIAGKITQGAINAEVGRIETVIATAKQYLGLAYQWGGSSPETGFDCSGFTQYCFAQAGITIPRVSYNQAAGGITVLASEIRPGDIVCFNSPVSHVGIYLGDGLFIHSPKEGDVVKITALQYMNLTKIVRYTGK